MPHGGQQALVVQRPPGARAAQPPPPNPQLLPPSCCCPPLLLRPALSPASLCLDRRPPTSLCSVRPAGLHCTRAGLHPARGAGGRGSSGRAGVTGRLTAPDPAPHGGGWRSTGWCLLLNWFGFCVVRSSCLRALLVQQPSRQPVKTGARLQPRQVPRPPPSAADPPAISRPTSAHCFLLSPTSTRCLPVSLLSSCP